jgi:hypothetical protein
LPVSRRADGEHGEDRADTDPPAIAGVGVMNMMLSSVSDRVSEIGIRMAVGASRADIRSQFLVTNRTRAMP